MKFTEIIKSTEKFKQLIDRVVTGLEQADPTMGHDDYNRVAMALFALVAKNKEYFHQCFTEMVTEENCSAFESFDTYSKLFGDKYDITISDFNSLSTSFISGYYSFWKIIGMTLFATTYSDKFGFTKHLPVVETAYRAVYGEFGDIALFNE